MFCAEKMCSEKKYICDVMYVERTHDHVYLLAGNLNVNAMLLYAYAQASNNTEKENF